MLEYAFKVILATLQTDTSGFGWKFDGLVHEDV